MLRRAKLFTLPLLVGLSAASTARADANPDRDPELGIAPSLDVSLDAPRPIVPRAAPLCPCAPAERAIVTITEESRVRWYGYQIIASDAAALVTATAGGGGVGAFVYVGGGPLVHLFHGNHGRAAASAGLRVGLPLVGFYAAAANPPETNNLGAQLAHLGTYAGIGMLSAIAIDSAIAFDRVPERKRTAVTPMVSAGRDGAIMGLGGVF